ncbi:hypothetical protein NQ318_019579 [Aromia moschata]|uniref:Myosin heavy chain n=1 Tax=Aromia moschata TaxID=1265417 RepID=A0AAV8Z4D2_9CUCU|nr:hypothetical protein NQ318_019579 [Aromia moschata]
MCTIDMRGRSYGPDGCQVPVGGGGGTCGETRTLEIINEFRRLYEEKMQEIDTAGGGDCLQVSRGISRGARVSFRHSAGKSSKAGISNFQEKIKLQQDWIGDLTAQNEMLVKAVEELEREATERVHVLEEKLHQSAQCICEVMKRYREYDVTSDLLAEPLQRVFCLENDQKNLLEFVRRIREENRWDVHGLKFYAVSYRDLFGSPEVQKPEPDSKKGAYKNTGCAKKEETLKTRECYITELHDKLDYYNKFGDVECLSKELECKREECISLQRSMKDTQQALVEEIATKYDAILQLKKECQQLEERCIQADKQTAFKDDIIKELRKEIKQLKQQVSLPEKPFKSNSLPKPALGVPESYLVINHSRKVVQSGKSTVIYLRSESDDKTANAIYKEHTSTCARCRKKLEDDLAGKPAEDEPKGGVGSAVRSLHLCKSENDLNAFKKSLRPVKERSRLTSGGLNRCNTSVGASDAFEARLRRGAVVDGLKEDCESLLEKVTLLEKYLDELKLLANNNLREYLEREETHISCTPRISEKRYSDENPWFENFDIDENLLKVIEDVVVDLNRVIEVKDTQLRKQLELIKILVSKLFHVDKGLQFLEERASEMKKKIAQLKDTVKELVWSLHEAEEKLERESKVCKICKGRAKVSFVENAEVQACIDGADTDQMETVQKRDEIIKVQSDTVNILQRELESLKGQESELRKEREKQCCEVQILKNRVSDLENALQDAEGRAANLQTAVDLYLNSVNVLEASEEKCKIETSKKLTISNLQSALVAAKQELDEVKQRSQESVSLGWASRWFGLSVLHEREQHGLINCFNVIMADAEFEKQNLEEQCGYVIEEYEYLQDMNFDLEVEHCNSLQDVDVLENQLFKYQSLLRSSEDECSEYRNYCKKLAKQKKCYEEVVAYFKKEMATMSEQLCNLQELLTLSNESAQEETCKLVQAYVNVQAENEKLSTRLAAAEQKAVLESQMNELRETKICELQQLISERELDLGRHDQAILNIRQSLQCSLEQNEELQATIVELHGTIAQLQDAVRMYEADNCRGHEGTEQCWAQIACCKNKLEELKEALDEKTAELCKLEMAYNDQARALKSAQMELKETRERQKDKQRQLKCAAEELKQKLAKSEEGYCKACCEITNLQTQLAALARKEAVKDLEVKRYRKIVSDLKNTLIELNKSLASGKIEASSAQNKCRRSECRKNVQPHADGANKPHDACLNCPCEVEFYQSIVETLKKSVIDLKKKLAESQDKNRDLEDACKCKDARLEELSTGKDKEHDELRKRLAEKLKQSQAEEARYLEMASQFEKELNAVRQELEVKTLQLNEVKHSAQEINSTKCIQLACAQEELDALKEEMNRMLRQHCVLNAENEKLHAQGACMQATVSKLEEKSQLLKGQLERYLDELQGVQREKEALVQKNCELLSELRSLQSNFGSVAKHQRYTSDSVKVLESELIEMRHERDEVCLESRNVINNVRAWLQEQRKIDEVVTRRERDYCDTIRRLRQDHEDMQRPYTSTPQRPCKKVVAPCVKSASPPPQCPSPWSLGSQGTASIHDGRSPSRSPCPDEECDWYSSTMTPTREEEDDDEDWVSKVEHLAAQVRRTNNIWKKKMKHPDDVVSRDTKK